MQVNINGAATGDASCISLVTVTSHLILCFFQAVEEAPAALLGVMQLILHTGRFMPTSRQLIFEGTHLLLPFSKLHVKGSQLLLPIGQLPFSR